MDGFVVLNDPRETMPAGRPPLFDSPDKLDQLINEYFTTSFASIIPSPITITGLALFLGFESRQSFYDYEKHEQFSYIIKRARLRVECEYEKKMQGSNPTGAIFALKNMGWSDKQEIDQKTEHSGQIGFTGINIIKPDEPNSNEALHT